MLFGDKVVLHTLLLMRLLGPGCVCRNTKEELTCMSCWFIDKYSVFKWEVTHVVQPLRNDVGFQQSPAVWVHWFVLRGNLWRHKAVNFIGVKKCCNSYFDPQGVSIVTGDHLCLSVAQPHQSEPPGVVSHGASAGSGSPLRKSWNRGLQDRSPLQRTLACLYDSVGNSSVDQLQWGQRWEERRSRKKKRKILGQAVVDHKSIYTRLHNMSTSRLWCRSLM